VSQIGRIESIFGAYFQDLFATCFTHLFQTQIRTDGEEFHKTERGFYSEQADLQKPPQYFTQLSHIVIFEDPFGPYFSEFWEAKSQKNRWQREEFKGTDHPQIPSKQCQISE
jgi:hypothetical protein